MVEIAGSAGSAREPGLSGDRIGSLGQRPELQQSPWHANPGQPRVFALRSGPGPRRRNPGRRLSAPRPLCQAPPGRRRGDDRRGTLRRERPLFGLAVGGIGRFLFPAGRGRHGLSQPEGRGRAIDRRLAGRWPRLVRIAVRRQGAADVGSGRGQRQPDRAGRSLAAFLLHPGRLRGLAAAGAAAPRRWAAAGGGAAVRPFA